MKVKRRRSIVIYDAQELQFFSFSVLKPGARGRFHGDPYRYISDLGPVRRLRLLVRPETTAAQGNRQIDRRHDR